MPENQLQAAVQAFETQTTQLRELMVEESRKRTVRERVVNRLFYMVVLAFILIALIGGLSYRAQTRRNDERDRATATAEYQRCTTTRVTRQNLKDNLIQLVEFALQTETNPSPAAKARATQFLTDYRSKLDHDLPTVNCVRP